VSSGEAINYGKTRHSGVMLGNPNDSSDASDGHARNPNDHLTLPTVMLEIRPTAMSKIGDNHPTLTTVMLEIRTAILSFRQSCPKLEIAIQSFRWSCWKSVTTVMLEIRTTVSGL